VCEPLDPQIERTVDNLRELFHRSVLQRHARGSALLQTVIVRDHMLAHSRRISTLAAGASTAELYLEYRTLMGVDGITFLDGTLYVNNVIFNKLYRIPVDAAGKPELLSISGWISR
jgi:hypothetical protein